MKLIVAEKPSVAKNISAALNMLGRSSEYLVTNCVGHLCTLAMPGDYDDRWAKWDLSQLPIIPEKYQYKAISGTKAQFEKVKALMNDRNVTGIINACDGDREGELIFRLVYEMANCRKPVERLWVSSMEPKAIIAGLSNLRPMSDFDNLGNAAKCREIADWLIGINLSRLYTLGLRSRQKLPVGRVQTPTVNMVVMREQEIRNFKPKQYWIVSADLGGFVVTHRCESEQEAKDLCTRCTGATAVVTKVDVKEKSESAPKLYDLTTLQQDCNKYFGLSAATTLEVLQHLYEEKLATYPRTDSRYITEKDLDMANDSLAKITGDGRIIPTNLDLLKRLNTKPIVKDSKVEGHPALLPTASGVDAYPGLRSSTKDGERKRQVLGLILYRLLEAVSESRLYTATKVEVSIGGATFVANGTTETRRGWRTVENVKKASIPISTSGGTSSSKMGSERSASGSGKDDVDNQEIPELKSGDELAVVKAGFESKKTSPPSRYTEATLLEAMRTCGRQVEDENQREAMKDKGLGTPATRASIIEKIIQIDPSAPGYITRGVRVDGKVKDAKHLYPTPQAERFMALLPSMLKAPDTTGDWEYQLAQIQAGNYQPQAFMGNIEQFVLEMIHMAEQNPFSPAQCNSIAAEDPNQDVVCQCPICNNSIIPYMVKFDKNRKPLPTPKTGYRCLTSGCFIMSDTIAGKKILRSQVKKMLATGTTGLLSGFTSQKGKPFSAEIVMEKDEQGRYTGKCKFKFPERTKVCDCPICGSPVTAFQFEKTNDKTRKKELFTGWGCSNRDCRLRRFYNPYYGRKFSDEEIATLMTSHEVGPLDGFVSLNGNKNSAIVRLGVKEGQDYGGADYITGEYYIEWQGDDLSICECPVCHSGQIRRWRTRSGYEGFKCDNEGCTMKPLFDGLCRHSFTPEEVYQLFTAGATHAIDDFVSKRGKKFTARVVCSRNQAGDIDGQKYEFQF